jgi:hypothetical protein
MNKTHHSEPWEVWNHDGDWTIVAKSRTSGILVDIGAAHFAKEDAQRLVLCVNACKNLTNEELDYLVHLDGITLETVDKLRLQRDALLSALRLTLDPEAYRKAYEAIHEVEESDGE